MGYINARDDAREQSYIINQIMSPIVNAMYYRANKKDDYQSETRKHLQAEADRMGRTAAQQELLKIQNDDTLSVVERWSRTQQIKGQVDGLKSQWIDTQMKGLMEQYKQDNRMFGNLFGGNKAGVNQNQQQRAVGTVESPYLEHNQNAFKQQMFDRYRDMPDNAWGQVNQYSQEPQKQTQEEPQPQVNYAEENRKAFKQNLFDQYRNMPDNQPQSQTQSKQQPQDKQVDYAAENEKAYKRDMLKQLSIQNKDFSKLEPYWYDMTPEEMTTAYKYIINGGNAEDIIKRLK
jgi:hypothetical protein